MMELKTIWEDFCFTEKIATEGKPLFQVDSSSIVATKLCGKATVLCRTPAVDDYLAKTAIALRKDYEDQTAKYDGILYMMFRQGENGVIPLYIGKTEKIGKKGSMSSLLKGAAPKPRWDDGPDYHIGGLSSCACQSSCPVVKKNYKKWASALFKAVPAATPTLRWPVFLWLRLWRSNETGLWKEYGSTSLCFQETLLINVANALFSRDILNTEGILR